MTLLFVSVDYTEFNVLANSNGSVEFFKILYYTSLNVERGCVKIQFV